MDSPITIQVPPFDAEAPAVAKYIRDLNTSWKMQWFFLSKLPSCWFWGVRIKTVNHKAAEVRIPYGWRTQNPFRSTYFAALTGAAELSTGLLATIALRGRRKVSMLITQVDAKFLKKANTETVFRCEQGLEIIDTVQKALETGEGHAIAVTSTGRNSEGVVVAQITFTWSFKVK